MELQQINLGAPVTGNGGDLYRTAHEKINDNFGVVKTEIESLALTGGPKGEPGADGLPGQNIIDQRTQLPVKLWTGTQAQYDAVSPKLADMLYLVKL